MPMGSVGALVTSLMMFCVASAARAEGGSASTLSDTWDHRGGTPRAEYGFVGAEFMSLAEVRAALPLLAARQVGVVLAWPSTEVDNPQFYALVRDAAALGVEVRPWLLLPREQGYWPNSTNARAFDAEARRLLERWLEEGLRPGTFIVDMEMPLGRALRYGELLRGAQTFELVRFLRDGINRWEYAAATRVYRDLVEFAHRQGFRVELSTLSQVLDDYLDGDDDLRQAMNVPVAGIDWDAYTFQVYRTLNAFIVSPTSGPTTSYYVYDYASRARGLFGFRAGVALGLVDPGELAPDAPVYASGRELGEDLEAARAAGISRDGILVYNLRGIVERTPSEQWFPDTGRFAWPPPPDLATVLTRTTTVLLDRSL